jgi:quercetin dioxygenase-like cupin family protein
MRIFQHNSMKGGWFVGNFEPCVFKTTTAEVGVKSYKAGETNAMHYHKCSTEVTLIISGECRMGDYVLNAGDIMVIEPYEESDFEAITDCTLVVYKSASVAGDKHVA